MLAYVIIAAAIALVIGSLMWMMPTPHEKKIARLRQNAIEAGFHPKFIKAEQFSNLLGKNLARRLSLSQAQVLRYSWHGSANGEEDGRLLVLFDEEGKLLACVKNGQEQDGKDCQLNDVQLNCMLELAACMPSLFALERVNEEGKRRISLYWTESGAIDKVDFKSPVFSDLQALI